MVDGARHIKSNKVTRSVPAYSAVKGEKTPIVAQIDSASAYRRKQRWNPL